MHNKSPLNDYINAKFYNVGIYVRLSREDDYKKVESESIQNQKEYCTNYVTSQGWNIVDYYCDDGYTGTNFERPGFQRLLDDIEKKKVNVVITKDLSRLGRDHIESGRYIETFFPEKSIRYIAINDNIDTFSDYDNMLNFRFAFNDQYPKDISRKVRTVMDAKRSKGDFIGAFAPYGYKKNSNDKNKLVVDEAAAIIVKRIFEMYINGTGFNNIANILNSEGVLSPAAYKKSQSKTYFNPNAKLSLWTAQTIRSILVSPTYIGNLTQGKYKKINYKSKKIINIEKGNWIISENTHEPIINKDIFQIVQNMLTKRSNKSYSSNATVRLLTGLIYCGDCGERMTFTKTQNGNVYCICSKYKRFNMCSRHSIFEKRLEKYIIDDLKNISRCVNNEEKLLKIAKNKFQMKDNDVDNVIKETLNKLEKIKEYVKTLYGDKLKGIISEEDFIDLSKDINKERAFLNKTLYELNSKKVKAIEIHSETDKLLKFVRDFKNFNNVDRVTLLKLIDRVEIFENKRIIIHYKFKNPWN